MKVFEFDAERNKTKQLKNRTLRGLLVRLTTEQIYMASGNMT